MTVGRRRGHGRDLRGRDGEGAGSVTWDGRGSSGAYVPDGTYDLALRPVDRASNRGSSITTAVVAYGALGFVASSAAAIHARDRDRFAATTKLSSGCGHLPR